MSNQHTIPAEELQYSLSYAIPGSLNYTPFFLYAHMPQIGPKTGNMKEARGKPRGRGRGKEEGQRGKRQTSRAGPDV